MLCVEILPAPCFNLVMATGYSLLLQKLINFCKLQLSNLQKGNNNNNNTFLIKMII